MGYGSQCVTSSRFCFSTEDCKEWVNNHYHDSDNDNQKIIPDSSHLPYCDVCKEYRAFRNNVCSIQSFHEVSLSCVDCKNVYIQ